MRRVGADAEQAGDLGLREVMTWGVVTVRPATDLREAARVMREQRLGALPVVDTGGRVFLEGDNHDATAHDRGSDPFAESCRHGC